MTTQEIPEGILRSHPELAGVAEALGQHRRGESITATCIKCGRLLQVNESTDAGVTIVTCPGGHVSYRSKHETLAPVIVSADEAQGRGLAAVTVRCDVPAAGMYARLFPDPDVLVALNGPPGGPLVVMVWDCKDANGGIEAVVRAKFVGPAAMPLEIVGPDRSVVLGREQTGLSFRTGRGQIRIAWFAFLLQRPGGTVMVGLGIGGHHEPAASAAMILSHSAIAAAVRTLSIE